MSTAAQPLLDSSPPPPPPGSSSKSNFLVVLVCVFLSLLFLPLLLPKTEKLSKDISSIALVQSACTTKEYADRTLKLTAEMSCLGWVADDDKKFEASDVAFVNNAFYVIADNSWQMQQFDAVLNPFNKDNKQLQPKGKTPNADSSFEALVYDPEANVFYGTREAMPRGTSTYVGEIWAMRVDEESAQYEVVERCDTEFEFARQNKGFEGMVLLKNHFGEVYLLGLCEGNFCSGGQKGQAKGKWTGVCRPELGQHRCKHARLLSVLLFM
eukprot:GHVS01033975.1.p1 GENE.GHVS01033975.1~~GHVS01033975.1.p1  ORF type:complete len:268 (-),score=57.37 GHVS01033975.1:206-1009(-)